MALGRYYKPEELRPIHDRVLVQRIQAAKQTASGIHLTDFQKTKYGQFARVVALSENVPFGKNGESYRQHDVKVGDLVALESGVDERKIPAGYSYVGTEVQVGGVDLHNSDEALWLIKAEDIAAVIEDAVVVHDGLITASETR